MHSAFVDALANHVRRRADTERRVAHALRVFLGQRDQVGHGAQGRFGTHQHQQRRHGNLGDGHEVLHRVVAQVLEQRRRNGEAARCRHQRVAVGRLARHHLCTDVAASARAVFHHHGLAQFGLHLFGQQARDDVATAAGCKGLHDAHGLVRPSAGGRSGLGPGPRGQRRQQADGGRGGRAAGEDAAARRLRACDNGGGWMLQCHGGLSGAGVRCGGGLRLGVHPGAGREPG